MGLKRNQPPQQLQSWSLYGQMVTWAQMVPSTCDSNAIFFILTKSSPTKHQQQQQTHQHHHHHLHRHYQNITKKVVFRFKALLKCDVLLFSGAVMSDCSVIRPSTFQIFWPFYWKKNSFDDVIPGDHWREDELKMKAPPLEKLPTSLSLESLAWVWGNYTNWKFDWFV